jgi:hypothetical protein
MLARSEGQSQYSFGAPTAIVNDEGFRISEYEGFANSNPWRPHHIHLR